MASRKQRQRRERPSERPSRRRELADPVSLVLAVAALFALLAAAEYGRQANGFDFYQFWVVGQVLSTGEPSDFYADSGSRLSAEYLERARRAPVSPRRLSVAENRPYLHTTATPFLYSLFGLVSSGRYDTDLERFQRLGLACVVGSLVLLSRVFGYTLPVFLAVLALVCQWFLPLYTEMRVVNVNRLQLAMLALLLWNQARRPGRQRDLLGGFVLGLAVLFKPNVLFAAGLLGFSWLADRRFRTLRDQCAGMAAAAGVALAVSGASFGSLRCWIDWLGAASTTHGHHISPDSGNVGLTMLIADWTGVRSEVPLTLVLLAIGVGFLWRSRTRSSGPSREGPREAAALAAGCLVYLLGARLVWIHYYVLALPALLIALRPGGAPRPFRWRQALALAALLPMSRVAPWQAALGGHLELVTCIFWASALTLYALMLAELTAGDTPEDAAAPAARPAPK